MKNILFIILLQLYVFSRLSLSGEQLREEELKNNFLTVDGSLKEPSLVCNPEEDRRCSRVQTIPVHIAGTPAITGGAERTECAPAEVVCNPPCPSCNTCSKVGWRISDT